MMHISYSDCNFQYHNHVNKFNGKIEMSIAYSFLSCYFLDLLFVLAILLICHKFIIFYELINQGILKTSWKNKTKFWKYPFSNILC